MSNPGSIPSQYAAAATVPLIKSPSLWLPKPVEMPNDIHPLPDDISAYFVYPFTLEPHILAQQPSISERIAAQRREKEKMLQDRIDAARREKAEALNRMAPGWNPTSFLTPQHLQPTPAGSAGGAGGGNGQEAGDGTKAQDPVDAFYSLKI